MSPVATSPEVTHAGDFVFRTAPSDASQGKALAEYANTKYKKVGMIVEQVDYAVALAQVFEDNFNGWTDNDPSSVSGVAFSGSKSAKISASR